MDTYYLVNVVYKFVSVAKPFSYFSDFHESYAIFEAFDLVNPELSISDGSLEPNSPLN